jgi:hypothetical protein
MCSGLSILILDHFVNGGNGLPEAIPCSNRAVFISCTGIPVSKKVKLALDLI